MNTPRRAAHRLFFTLGNVDLCPDCMSVLAKEGEVAGDPREPAVTFTGHRRTEPAPLGVPCDTCASLEAYEEALNASRIIYGQPVGPAYGLDANGIHVLGETPTLAEMEGDDAPPPEDEHFSNGLASY
jgi:hypothetical protein